MACAGAGRLEEAEKVFQAPWLRSGWIWKGGSWGLMGFLTGFIGFSGISYADLMGFHGIQWDLW